MMRGKHDYTQFYEAADGPIAIERMTLMHLHAAIAYTRQQDPCSPQLQALVARAKEKEAGIRREEQHPNPFLNPMYETQGL